MFVDLTNFPLHPSAHSNLRKSDFGITRPLSSNSTWLMECSEKKESKITLPSSLLLENKEGGLFIPSPTSLHPTSPCIYYILQLDPVMLGINSLETGRGCCCGRIKRRRFAVIVLLACWIYIHKYITCKTTTTPLEMCKCIRILLEFLIRIWPRTLLVESQSSIPLIVALSLSQEALF